MNKTLAKAWITFLQSVGFGNVYGPASNTDNYIPQWNGADSKTLKDGISLSTLIQTTGDQTVGGTKTFSNTTIMTEAAIAALAVDWNVPQHYKTIDAASAFTFTNAAPSTSTAPVKAASIVN